MKESRKTVRRLGLLTLEMIELQRRDPKTPADIARMYELLAEMDGLTAPTVPAPQPALPPGTGTFVMRRREPLTYEEIQAEAWKRIPGRPLAMGATSKIWDPEGDAARAARIDRQREHVTGLVPRSAMRRAR